MPSETKSIVESHSDLTMTGTIESKVDTIVYFRILMLEVNGRRDYRGIDGMNAGKSLNRTCGSQQMPVHGFGRTDTQTV